MSCDNVQERISSFLDRDTPGEEKENVLAHIRSCRDCSAALESQQTAREALRGLRVPAVPEDLTARLRVIASHERQRQLSRVSLSTRFGGWHARLHLAFDNLMRPLAFPFAGGLVSSLMIFGLLFPSLTFQHALAEQAFVTSPDGDVVMQMPNGEYVSLAQTESAPHIQRADLLPPASANIVELTLDSNGRVSDWSVANGELTQDIANIIMFGQFDPATHLGVPIPSKVRAFQNRTVATPPIRVRS